MQKRRIDNQLVVLAILLDDLSQSFVVGATHISCFSAKMLRISNSTYLFIMFRASVTRIHDYWFSEAFSCRIEYVLYQCLDVLPGKGREFAAASADELLFLEVLHTRTKYLVHIVTATVGATTVTAVTTVAVASPVATIGAAVTGF